MDDDLQALRDLASPKEYEIETIRHLDANGVLWGIYEGNRLVLGSNAPLDPRSHYVRILRGVEGWKA